MRKRLLDLLTRYRGVVLVGVGLPAGLAFDAALRLSRLLSRGRRPAPEKHDERVAAVQAQVQGWAAQPEPERRPLCTDRKTWMNLSTRFAPKHQWHRVRMGALRDVLSLDTARGVVRVEPFVTVGQATRYLLARGFMLEVTLEIEDATLGGLALAVGMTTHSHKAGLLHETVEAYEVVLADGRLVRVTATEHADLFRALPWSHGTLGLLVALELRVIPARPYVRLRYEPVRSREACCERLHELATAPDAPHFLEATVFDRDRAVVMAGELVDEPGAGVRRNPIGRFYKPWFYKHVEGFLGQDGATEELIPLRHYLMRHNRSIFWVAADMIPFGNHPAFRWLLGWMMPPRIAFLKFSTTPAVRRMTFTQQVFQDIVLPMSAMARALEVADRLFGMYPILLYPCRIYDHGQAGGQLRPPRPEDRVPGTDHGMYFDLGVYGVPGPIRAGQPFRTVHAMREMEAFTRQVGGYPFLYADTFMDREEFRQMFDLRLYDQVRARYGAAGAFPDLYDKIRPEVDVFAVLAEEAAGEGRAAPTGAQAANGVTLPHIDGLGLPASKSAAY